MDKVVIPDEIITDEIYFIGNMKVMLDRDLATLYNVERGELMNRLRETSQNFLSILCFNWTKASLKT